MELETLYMDKEDRYYNQVRYDLISILNNFINKTDRYKYLDVGCGSCDTLVYLKENEMASSAEGIELMAIDNSNQQNELVDKLWIGPIEEKLGVIENNAYDIILCLDVLEHLVDPWSIVHTLADKLKVGGYLFISCPNIREIKTMVNIFIGGKFEYAEAGILDKTHLRFFCANDLKDLGTTEKLEFIELIPNYKMAPNRGKFRWLHFSYLDTIFAPQYFCVSRKKLD